MRTLSQHRKVIDDLIGEFRGRCATTVQAAIAAANADLPEGERMAFRIGINVGDVMVKNGDIFGDGVNIAARLETLAEPGGVCVSRGVRDQTRRLGRSAHGRTGRRHRVLGLGPRRRERRWAAAVPGAVPEGQFAALARDRIAALSQAPA
jgi:class 3 adenylate cyclase